MHVFIHRASDSFNASGYVHRLETALGTPYFDTVFKELESDSRVTQDDLLKIVADFVTPMAKITSRRKLLDRIYYRHKNLMAFKNESERTGTGRRSAS